MPSITTLCAAGLIKGKRFSVYHAVLITQSLTWEISIEK